jgi:hypothetical protein
MKIKVILAFSLMAGLFALASCCTCKKDTMNKNNVAKIASPQAIIYKTNGDYSQLVPVILTPDKKGIESYPDIKDVYYKGKLAVPTVLHNGFLLDNRGISENVAFIKLTYEQYASLPATPTTEEIMQMIVDKNPISTMYSCGQRGKFADIENELNASIDSNNFSGFTRLK